MFGGLPNNQYLYNIYYKNNNMDNVIKQMNDARAIWLNAENHRIGILNQLNSWSELHQEPNNQLETAYRVAMFISEKYEYVYLTLTSLLDRIASGRV